MNWRDVRLGDLADWVGDTVNNAYESGTQYIKGTAQYIGEKNLGEMANDASDLARNFYNSAGKTVGDTYKAGAKIAQESVQYLTETNFSEIIDDITGLAGNGVNQAAAFFKSAPIETISSITLVYAAITVLPCGIAWGGTAISGSIIFGCVAVSLSPAITTAILAGGAAYCAYLAYQKYKIYPAPTDRFSYGYANA